MKCGIFGDFMSGLVNLDLIKVIYLFTIFCNLVVTHLFSLHAYMQYSILFSYPPMQTCGASMLTCKCVCTYILFFNWLFLHMHTWCWRPKITHLWQKKLWELACIWNFCSNRCWFCHPHLVPLTRLFIFKSAKSCEQHPWLL